MAAIAYSIVAEDLEIVDLQATSGDMKLHLPAKPYGDLNAASRFPAAEPGMQLNIAPLLWADTYTTQLGNLGVGADVYQFWSAPAARLNLSS